MLQEVEERGSSCSALLSAQEGKQGCSVYVECFWQGCLRAIKQVALVLRLTATCCPRSS